MRRGGEWRVACGEFRKRCDGPGVRRTPRALARGAKQSARMRSVARCVPPAQDRWRRSELFGSCNLSPVPFHAPRLCHSTLTSSAAVIRPPAVCRLPLTRDQQPATRYSTHRVPRLSHSGLLSANASSYLRPSGLRFKSPVSAFVPRLRRGNLCYS